MEQIKDLFSILGGIFALLVVPFVKYTANKEAQKAIEDCENKMAKMIADQKVQVDREYLDLRDSIDRKFDKFDLAQQELNRMLNTFVSSMNERITKTELDTRELMVKMDGGNKHYEQFQKMVLDNFNRVHERLDLISKDVHR